MPVEQLADRADKPSVQALWSYRRIILGLAILGTLVRLFYAYQRAAVPFQLEYEEGNILNAGFRILHGSTPYPAAGSFPYVLNPYGPVAYFLAAAAMKLLGVSLFGPRLFVLLAGAGAALLIVLISKAQGVRIEIASLFGFFYLCSPIMWKWLPLLRVDLWAIFFTLAGLYVFSSNPRRWAVAAIIFALALLTKHTTVAAPAACVLELTLEKKCRTAFSFSGVIAAIVTMGVCLASFRGSPLFHLLKTHPDPYNLIRWFVGFSITAGWACLVLAILIYGVTFHFRPKPENRLAWMYFGLSCMTGLTAGKLGSNTNHFLEWTAAACVMGALALNYLLEIREPLADSFVGALTALCVCLTLLPHAELAQPQEQVECPEAYAFVQSFPGDRVLSEDVSGVLLSGKPVLVSNPFVVTQLGNSVSWSQGGMEALVGERYFDLILFGDDPHVSGRWSPALKDAVSKNYKLQRQFRCSPYMTSAFVPK